LIIDPFNPYSKYFDASLIWGPVHGRSVYAGFRYRM
jgi:outer membrane receptor for ferrienterochelin and colicins